MSHWITIIETSGMAGLGEHLDGLDDAARVAETRAVSGTDQARLWELASGSPADLHDFVPAGTEFGRAVIHAGKNSLPVFRNFQKRFCRASSHPEVVYGYNEGATRPVVGPGYFEVRAFEGRSEVGIDYTRVPDSGVELPVNWPDVRLNEAGLSRFVYSGMVDYMRRISSHVTVGRATRGGKETSNYFLLCRTGV